MDTPEQTPIYEKLHEDFIARDMRVRNAAHKLPSILTDIDWDSPLAIDTMYRHELPDGTVFYSQSDSPLYQ